MMKEKRERNGKMFREWYAAFRTYGLTACAKDRISHKVLAEKYGISIPTVREILQRELTRYLKRRGIKI